MRPRRDIGGAVVVITGASSGIGKATALAFAGLGARLVLAVRDPEALGEVERACQARGAQCWWCRPTSATPMPWSGWPAGR